MGILKNIAMLTGPGAIKYGYDKLRKNRAENREKAKQVKRGQEKAVKKEEKAYPLFKKGIHELEDIIRGKGAPVSDLGEIQKRFERAGKGAEKLYAPIKEQAIADFNQSTRPNVTGQFAPNQYGGSAGSSAMNQALSAAQGNLQRQINADFAGFQTTLAGNILNASQNAKQQNLMNRYGASQAAIGQPSAYAPPTQAPASGWQQYGPLAAGALGAIGGGMAGGPAGAFAGFQGGTQIGQTVFR